MGTEGAAQMFPMGQMAFAYVVYRLARRAPVPPITFAFLMGGAVFPAFANEGLVRWHVLPINPLWFHSVAALASVWVAFAVVRRANVPWLTRASLAFAVGYTTHLVSDPPFEFAHLYFSILTDDIGESWFFPFAQVTVRQPRLEPGFYLLPWQLAVEGIAMTGAVAHWWTTSRVVNMQEFASARLLPAAVFLAVGLVAVWQALATYPDPR